VFVWALTAILGAGSSPAAAQQDASPEAEASEAQAPARPAEPPPAVVPSEVMDELRALRSEVEALKRAAAERELSELKAAAESAASGQAEEPERLGTKSFRGGERSLQGLNPELSIVGDAFGKLVLQDGEVYTGSGDRSGFFLRVLGLHFQSNLDPFSMAKMVVGISPGGVELGEAYITWSALAPGFTLTFGKFHQQFGVVNRWHAPGLDQVFYPLALSEHFGGPLKQVGLSLLVTLPPLWADELSLELQITNGQNASLFTGDYFSVPCGLLHLRNYWDLNRDTYLELGLSALVGTNNPWGKRVEEQVPVQLYDEDGNPVIFYDANGNPIAVVQSTAVSVQNDTDWRVTVVAGGDLTLNWEPVRQAKYLGFTWRSEFLVAYKQVSTPGGGDAILSWGGYSYAQVKPLQNWIFGIRGDVTQAFVLDNDGQYTWGITPYITWWQSPWVRLRLEYDYIDWADCKGMQPEHRALLQVTFSVGPHKHERY
jgi:hypothetical protein